MAYQLASDTYCLTFCVKLGILRACEVLQPHHLVILLKSVKHLSMNVVLLDILQQANAIDVLVKILEAQDQGPHATVRSSVGISVVSALTSSSLGVVKSYIPDMLQPLPSEQVSTRRGGAGWNHPVPQERDPDDVAAETIRASNPLRPSRCWKELSAITMAAEWARYVP